MKKSSIGLGLLVLLPILVGILAINSYFEEHIEVMIVQKMFIDPSKEGSHYVLTTDKGLFEVQRPINKVLDPNANPDRVWGQLHEGKKYKITYLGWRIDFIYYYPYVFHVEALP